MTFCLLMQSYAALLTVKFLFSRDFLTAFWSHGGSFDRGQYFHDKTSLY
jgi:hypothetical protein